MQALTRTLVSLPERQLIAVASIAFHSCGCDLHTSLRSFVPNTFVMGSDSAFSCIMESSHSSPSSKCDAVLLLISGEMQGQGGFSQVPQGGTDIAGGARRGRGRKNSVHARENVCHGFPGSHTNSLTEWVTVSGSGNGCSNRSGSRYRALTPHFPRSG